jgi:hypothetical protein
MIVHASKFVNMLKQHSYTYFILNYEITWDPFPCNVKLTTLSLEVFHKMSM